MSLPVTEGYDEPGSRTRFAWLRTMLVFLAVDALAVRGLLVRGGPKWLLVLIALGFLAFLVVSSVRVVRLGPWTSPAVPRGLVLAAASCAVAGGVLAALAMGLSP